MTELKYDGDFLQIFKKDNWEYVTRKKGKDAVIIVPVRKNKILLLKEFRVPLNSYVLGLPAGLVGDKEDNTDVFAAARREMVEETGYSPNTLKLLAESLPSSSGLTDEKFTLMMATDLVQVGEGGGDETENIESMWVNLSDIHTVIDSFDGLVSPKIFMALYFIALERGYDRRTGFGYQQ